MTDFHSVNIRLAVLDIMEATGRDESAVLQLLSERLRDNWVIGQSDIHLQHGKFYRIDRALAETHVHMILEGDFKWSDPITVVSDDENNRVKVSIPFEQFSFLLSDIFLLLNNQINLEKTGLINKWEHGRPWNEGARLPKDAIKHPMSHDPWEIDYVYWGDLKAWRLQEAVHLISRLPIEPSIGKGDPVPFYREAIKNLSYPPWMSLPQYINLNVRVHLFERILPSAKRSVQAGILKPCNNTQANHSIDDILLNPVEFLEWAKGSGFGIPKELNHLLSAPDDVSSNYRFDDMGLLYDKKQDIETKLTALNDPIKCSNDDFSQQQLRDSAIAALNKQLDDLNEFLEPNLEKYNTAEKYNARMAYLLDEPEKLEPVEHKSGDADVVTHADDSDFEKGTHKPGDLIVIVDDVNDVVNVRSINGKYNTKFGRKDVVGKGTVTWLLLVAFAKCNGSLEGNSDTDVKKLNTPANRKNLSGKLVSSMKLNTQPIVKGRSGIMRFQSIRIAGGASSIDALDREKISYDDQATGFLSSNGDHMPVPD
ncbi:MAG: hypothetical protein V3U75_01805 [Methylococcaceae bacterium]